MGILITLVLGIIGIAMIVNDKLKAIFYILIYSLISLVTYRILYGKFTIWKFIEFDSNEKWQFFFDSGTIWKCIISLIITIFSLSIFKFLIKNLYYNYFEKKFILKEEKSFIEAKPFVIDYITDKYKKAYPFLLKYRIVKGYTEQKEKFTLSKEQYIDNMIDYYTNVIMMLIGSIGLNFMASFPIYYLLIPIVIIIISSFILFKIIPILRYTYLDILKLIENEHTRNTN